MKENTFSRTDLIIVIATMITYFAASAVLDYMDWPARQSTPTGYNFLQPVIHAGLAGVVGFIVLIILLQIARAKSWNVRGIRGIVIPPLCFLVPSIIGLGTLAFVSDFFTQPLNYTDELRSMIHRNKLIYLTALIAMIFFYRWKTRRTDTASTTQTI